MTQDTPIQHIVLFSFKPEVTSDDRLEVIERFRDLKREIDGIIEINFGDNISQSALARDWDFASVATLASRQVLADFLAHPAHDRLSKTTTPLYEQCVVFDLPLPRS